MEQNYQTLFKNLNAIDCQYHDQNQVNTLCTNEQCENYFKIACSECLELMHSKDSGSQLVGFKKQMQSAAKQFEDVEQQLKNFEQNEEQKKQQNESNPRDQCQKLMLSKIKEWIIFGEILNNKCQLISKNIKENYSKLFENEIQIQYKIIILEVFEKIRNSKINEELNAQLQILKNYFAYDKEQKQMKFSDQHESGIESFQIKKNSLEHYLLNLNQQKQQLEQKVEILSQDSLQIILNEGQQLILCEKGQIYKQLFNLKDSNIQFLDAQFSSENLNQESVSFNSNKNIIIDNKEMHYSFILLKQSLQEFKNKIIYFEISVDFSPDYFFFGATTLQAAINQQFLNFHNCQVSSTIYFQNNLNSPFKDYVKFGVETDNLKLSQKEDLTVLFDGFSSKLWLFKTQKPDERVGIQLEQGFNKYQENWHIAFGHGCTRRNTCEIKILK